MRNEPLAIGGLLLLGAAAAIGGPKALNKVRLAAHRATGTTFRSGISRPGVRATAYPARGIPA
ncbi:hypothetical protein HJG53_14550 [Sphingomonas sp. ID1715]|uniref:hypothetical protein n=1 Tax=Sphingomonas sp. ID1715 TaxID=1656898 RepID=UPI00148903C1|nr:hypothetical protein [Sphingomonas sp. ID1715]NNM78120.1 hypothetical protein [Sphingomonas sp. ID1715]